MKFKRVLAGILSAVIMFNTAMPAFATEEPIVQMEESVEEDLEQEETVISTEEQETNKNEIAISDSHKRLVIEEKVELIDSEYIESENSTFYKDLSVEENDGIMTTSAEEYIDTGTCGETLQYLLNSEGVLTISGSGKMNDYYVSEIDKYKWAPWYYYRDKIKQVVIGEDVTTIGDYAFYECNLLENISIGEKVSSIGSFTFGHCKSLKHIKIPKNVQELEMSTFYGCNFETAGPIGGGYDYEFGWTTQIPLYAFYWCESLNKIVIPSTITSIGSSAFSKCKFETAGPIGGGYDYEFGWTTQIPAYAFYGCKSLKSVIIPNNIEKIGDYSFEYCEQLEVVIFPDTISEIGFSAFYNCDNVLFKLYSGSYVEDYAIRNNIKYESIGNSNCLITLDFNDGVREQSTINVIYNDKMTKLPTPSRENCEFLGWYTKKEGGELVTTDSICNGNTTLYAHWKSNSYNYDAATNTLTFENFTNIGIDFPLKGESAFIYNDEFLNVVLIGENEIIIEEGKTFPAILCEGNLSITGNGSLTTNSTLEANNIVINGNKTKIFAEKIFCENNGKIEAELIEAALTFYKDLTIENTKIVANYIYVENALSILDCNLHIGGNLYNDNDFGIYARKSIDIKNGTLTIIEKEDGIQLYATNDVDRDEHYIRLENLIINMVLDGNSYPSRAISSRTYSNGMCYLNNVVANIEVNSSSYGAWFIKTDAFGCKIIDSKINAFINSTGSSATGIEASSVSLVRSALEIQVESQSNWTYKDARGILGASVYLEDNSSLSINANSTNSEACSYGFYNPKSIKCASDSKIELDINGNGSCIGIYATTGFLNQDLLYYGSIISKTGIFTSDDLIFDNSNIEIISEDYVLRSKSNITIEKGNIKASCSDNGKYAIYTEDGVVTLGASNIELRSSNGGIYGYDIYIKDGTHSITAPGQSAYGLKAVENVQISGGTSMITGGKKAISSGSASVSISDKCYIGAGENQETAVTVNAYAGQKYIEILPESNTKCVIKFVTDSNETIKSQVLNRRSLINEPIQPIKNGYSFTGWYKSFYNQTEDNLWDFSKDVVFTDMTLYAGWKANQYNVVFDANGGTVASDEITVIYGSNYGSLPVPVRTGYIFDGWYTTLVNGVEKDASAIVTTSSDHTLYAQWTAKTYTVSFETNGGSVSVNSKNIIYDDVYGKLPLPEYAGYTFVGWFTDKDEGEPVNENTRVKLTDDHILYAHWELTPYTVIFNTNGGTVLPDSITVKYDGSPYGNLPIPEFPGHDFLGWYTEQMGGDLVDASSTLPSPENQILYAHWECSTFMVTFDANGGSTDIPHKTVVFDGYYDELPIPEKIGYNFSGWYTDRIGGTCITSSTIVETTVDQTLYAQWEPEKYVITFDSNNGTECKELIVNYGMNYGSLPTPMLAGNKFLGWYDSENNKIEETSIVLITSDHALTAHWEPKYTVEIPMGNITSDSEVEEGTRVYLTSKTNGAFIYYTVDGSNPNLDDLYSENNPGASTKLYDDAIIITEDVEIRAIAVKENYNNSEIISISYKIKDMSNEWGDITENDRIEKGFLTTKDIPKELWLAGVSDQDYTGNAIVFDDLHVYDYKTLLEINTDYSVKYSNNKQAGVAKITITGKGNYTGKITKTFNINKLSLGTEEGNSQNINVLDVTLYESGKVQKGTTVVTYNINGKDILLKKGTDFSYLYSPEFDYKSSGDHVVTIIGKGNFTGSAIFKETILPNSTNLKLISKMKISSLANQYATGKEITPDVVIKDKEYTLIKGQDYELDYQNNSAIGNATIIITGKGDYSGSKTVQFKIVATSIGKANVEGIINMDYTGDVLKQSGYILTYKTNKNSNEELKEGIDYTVSYQNNTNAGKNKAYILFTGIGRFTGVLKKSFTINAHELQESYIQNIELDSVMYEKGGSKPKFSLVYGNHYLKEGVDYTVQYSNNTSINDGTNPRKIPTATIKGKGNFKGTIKKTFSIIPSSLDNTTMTVSDIVYAKKTGTCKPKIVVYDTNGKTLVAGKDYDKKSIKYIYAKDICVVQKIGKKDEVTLMKQEGSEVDLKKDIIPVGAEIIVTISGINNYANSTKSAILRYVAADISKATVKITKKIYTGTSIELFKNEIKVSLNKQQLSNTDYEIVGYSKNLKKGSATVTICGVGNYGGKKSVIFSINSRTMNHTIIYEKNALDAVGTMVNSVIELNGKVAANKYSRKGYVFEGWALSPDGDVVIKNKSKLILDNYDIYGTTIKLYAKWLKTAY